MTLGQLDSQFLGQCHGFGCDLHADRKDHHVEGLGHHLAIFGHVPQFEVTAVGHRVDGVNAAADETHPLFFAGVVVKPLEILTGGPHVHEKDGAVEVAAAVLLGDDGFFDGIHAADR